MSTIKIVEWNINQRSRSTTIPTFVCTELVKDNPHIIFLVEYKKNITFNSALEKEGYTVVTSKEVKGQNEVLIALKNGCKFENIVQNDIGIKDSLNMLSVSVLFEGKKLCLLGARVRVGQYSNANEYANRGTQLKDLQKYVSDIQNQYQGILIGGDFNHCQIRYEENDDFAYDGYLQKPCSYQKIKKLFKEKGLKVCTPQGDNREVFSWVGKRRYNYCIKEDHFIISDSIQVEQIAYDWSFVSNKNGYKELTAKSFKSNLVGRADHAKLVAEIIL